jgi:putative transposase
MKGFDYTGPYAYSLTINTDSGRRCFNDKRFVEFCIKTLSEMALATGFDVLAYCFMPNHLHLLVQGKSESSNLHRFVQRFKQVTGFAYKTEEGRSLWHRSFYDHVARRDEDLHAAAAYIWANPVKAALVDRAEDYPYSGPAERLTGRALREHIPELPKDASRVGSEPRGEEAALGGQSLSSVRTGPIPRPTD